MGASSAVRDAVWSQLSDDHKGYPSTGKEVMEDDYKYDAGSMPNFLSAVSDRLAQDSARRGSCPCPGF